MECLKDVSAPRWFGRVGFISVHDTYGTKGGLLRHISISVQTRSCLVHCNSAYATSVHRQCDFGTQSVHQEYDFGTCLDRYQVSAYKIILKAKNSKKIDGFENQRRRLTQSVL